MADIQELTNRAIEILHSSQESELILNKDIQFLLLKQDSPSDLSATFYDSALCLILQGGKEIIAGRRRFSFGVGELLIVSHEIPVVSKITEASVSKPYIALVLRLDHAIIRGLHGEYAQIPFDMDGARSLEVNEANNHIIDSLFRLLNATQVAADSIVLLPQILREVHFRLLQAPCGGMLRSLLRHNSHASKIRKAISLIRCNYRDPLVVAEVARSVGMSASSFFHHFKVITESTPLQYQKNIRLMEARRLLVDEGESVTITALKVGYESPSQFSREYVRKFGSTPSSDSRTGVLSPNFS
ncbi:AraC family transcriptional regulator [Desulfopila sp. IMCC35008]|uniref:AraC family transcriptional regulator n=1 Tax=Desulfopila sp. IMCC35008 TaxID=2653858 RepID=UPI0013D1A34A|nr:AraC family transcriptional regulator [Desulfopila sp. IMCC35008]